MSESFYSGAGESVGLVGSVFVILVILYVVISFQFKKFWKNIGEQFKIEPVKWEGVGGKTKEEQEREEHMRMDEYVETVEIFRHPEQYDIYFLDGVNLE